MTSHSSTVGEKGVELPTPRPARLRRSEFVFEFRVFDGHVFEFAGLEYLATFKALEEFRVFVARHDAHTGVLALCHVASLLGNWGRRDWLHKSGLNSCPSGSGQRRRKVGGILALVLRLSSLEISSRELRCATAQACSCKVRAGRSMQNRNLASATCMSSADFSQIQTIFVAMVTLSSSAICGGMTFFEPVHCVGCIYPHVYLGLSRSEERRVG